MWAGEMVQQAKCLPGKLDNLSLMARIYIKVEGGNEL